MKLTIDPIWLISKSNQIILKKLESKQNLKTNKEDKNLSWLINHKLIKYSKNKYLLTFTGHDSLAILHLRNEGLSFIGTQVGIGKESDIYNGIYKNKKVVLKICRLGRVSYKKNVSNNFDYSGDWIKKCCLHTKREYEIMKMLKYDLKKLYENNNDINNCIINIDLINEISDKLPNVLDYNRHIIIIEQLNYETLVNEKDINLDKVYNELIDFIENLYKIGYIHGDLNEFNIMIDRNSNIKIIDFSHYVKIDDCKAIEYLKRDIKCVKDYFKRRFRYENDRIIDIPQLLE